MIEKYSSALYRYRIATIVISIIVSAVLIMGAKNLGITTDFRAFFGDDNPQLTAFESLEESFTRQDTLVFYLESKQGDLFQKSIIEVVQQLTEKAWQLPYSTRVDSISNFQYTFVDGDSLLIEDMIGPENTLTKSELLTIRKTVLSEPSLKNTLASENGKVTAIKVTLDLPREAAAASQEIVDEARLLVNQFTKQNPAIIIRLLGSVSINIAMKEVAEHDMTTLVIASYLLIIGGLIVLLRSFRHASMTLLIISLSVMATLGFFGWLGYVLAPIAGMVPSAIMIIAIADSIHLIKSYRYEVSKSENNVAVIAALKANVFPIVLTSITTIIGVLSLNFSDSPPYQALGNMVAFGVFIAMLLSLTLLPALLFLFPESDSDKKKKLSSWPTTLSHFIIKYKKLCFITTLTVVVIFGSFLGKNELNEKWYEYFDESMEITKSVNAFNDNLSGIHHIDYQLRASSGSIHLPAYLNQVDAFRSWWLEQKNVVTVSSFTDIVKRTNQNMHADDPAWYRIPDNQALSSQYYLLYSLSLPLGLGTDNLVDLGQESTRFTVTMRKTDSNDLLALDALAQQWLMQNAPDIRPASGSSLDIIFAKITKDNLGSLIQGSVLALIVISALLMITLKSVKLGIISLIPNLAPAAVAYGVWGATVGHIDMALSIIVCLSLGIVVDDTVHFLSKYLAARRRGESAEQAIEYTFRTVGSALLTTSVVLVCGFSILGLSDFTGSSSTGIMMALTIAVALVVDFLLLPPLLLLFDAKTDYSKSRLS